MQYNDIALEIIKSEIIKGKTIKQICIDNNISYSKFNNFLMENQISKEDLGYVHGATNIIEYNGGLEYIKQKKIEGYTQQQIAEEIGFTDGGTIRNYLRNKNVKWSELPNILEYKGGLNFIIKSKTEGKTQTMIAEELGISVNTVKRYLIREHGITWNDIKVKRKKRYKEPVSIESMGGLNYLITEKNKGKTMKDVAKSLNHGSTNKIKYYLDKCGVTWSRIGDYNVNTVYDDETFQEFVSRMKFSNEKTIQRYASYLLLFSTHVGKSLGEIITDAKNDYGIHFADEGSVYKYLTSFHDFLINEKNFTQNTRITIIGMVKTFYKCFFIPVDKGIAFEYKKTKRKVLADIITVNDVKRVFLGSPLFFKPLILTCFSTGLRVSDILKLDCGDFVEAMKYYSSSSDINDLLDDLKSLIDGGELVGVVHNVSNKTNVSHYTYLNPQCVKWIVISLLEYDNLLTNDSPLFRTVTGVRFSSLSAGKVLKTVRDELGYGNMHNSNRNKIHFHGFRDAFATILVNYIDYFHLENLMGHVHNSGHGNYVVQDPLKNRELYERVMDHLMFSEDFCQYCDYCKFYDWNGYRYCEWNRGDIENNRFNLDSLLSGDSFRIRFVNGDSMDWRLCNISEEYSP